MGNACLGQHIQAVGIFLIHGQKMATTAFGPTYTRPTKQLVRPLLIHSIQPTDEVCKLQLEAKVAEAGFCCVHFGLWVVPA